MSRLTKVRLMTLQSFPSSVLVLGRLLAAAASTLTGTKLSKMAASVFACESSLSMIIFCALLELAAKQLSLLW